MLLEYSSSPWSANRNMRASSAPTALTRLGMDMAKLSDAGSLPVTTRLMRAAGSTLV